MSQDQEDPNPQTTEEDKPKDVRYSKVQNNRNFIVGRIYNLTGDVTELRVTLKKHEDRKEELETKLKNLESVGLEGQEAYENKKKIKEVGKEISVNDDELDKIEDMLENKEEKVERFQVELDDSIEYEMPKKI